MGLLTRKELMVRCHVPANRSGDIGNWVKRGKLVVTNKGGEEFFDDNDPVNARFISDRERVAPVGDGVPVAVTRPGTREERKNEASAVVSRAQLDVQEQLLDIAIKKQQERYVTIKADKAEGSVIPTDVVKMLFLQYSKDITHQFRQGIERLVEEMIFKYNLSPADGALLRGQMVKMINLSVANAVDDAKKGIKTIVDQFSETKGKGEK
ncbi:MAG: hypothetical protein KF744_09180 [Taibaiella sp.]|nr:hypothetical protein [Taibaiella sp.]